MTIDTVDAAQLVIEMPASPQSRFDGYLSLGTQYIYRGVALRDSGPVPSAEIAFNHSSGWFIDTWGGQIDIRDYYRQRLQREWQTDISTGYSDELTSNWQWSLAHAWIINFDRTPPHSQNYREWRLNFFYRSNLATQIAYTDNYRQLGYAVWNFEAKCSFPVADIGSGEIGIGHSHSNHSGDNDAQNHYLQNGDDNYSNYNYGWIAAQKHWFSTDWKLGWHYSTSGARTILDRDRAGSRVELTLSWPLF